MPLPDARSSAADRAARADVPVWVTPDLIEKTVRVWSRRSGRAVTRDEAVGILLRVGTLLDVLTRR